MSDQPPVRLDVDADGIATLTLNRPEQLNAFDLKMIEAWRAALEAAEADERVKVVVVTGAGRAFCAGGDFEEMAKFSEMNSLDRKNFLYRNVHRIPLALERMDKPVIAAINGAARGAGLDMALMCDMRFMAQSATLAETYINIGLIAGDAGSWFLPRLIGTARALELFWSGRVVGAEEAERIGMVNRSVPDADLLKVTYDFARTVAAKPQQAVRFFRRAVYQSQTMALGAHLDMVSSHMAVLEDLPEHRDGIAAFRNRARGKA
ncbi:enoyl-CoA hydratase [Caenimonas sedimenti]|uniref:Enoyl-CoA hydratase n=1 Tax=Caenimonas sedimenti TaxID=2596921 RepID=A0A562ZSR3_9BURK|nr:enoyl-CoA hydratase-related protein [Caenimonas sedimenti]TWO71325.1 enoyl-CoA hydratase [Caenimonas sedimenti]